MALRVDDLIADRERVEPHMERLKAAVLRRDPEATFSLHPSNVVESWVLNAYVRPDLEDDLDLLSEFAEIGTDLLVDNNIDVIVSRHTRSPHSP